jgi:hypothetical protein
VSDDFRPGAPHDAASSHPSSDHRLRHAMRDELDSHTPDRTAMLNRIAANRSAGARPRGRFVRLAGSGLAVLLVLGLGGVAKWALAGQSPPPAAAPATPSAGAVDGTAGTSAVATATSPPDRSVTTRSPASVTSAPPASPSAPATPSASPVRGHPGDTQVEKGSLWSDGSIPSSGRSEVTLKPRAALTELDLTIRVTLTDANLSSSGFVTPAETITATVSPEPGALLYHFVMRKGATLPPGTYVFAAKYTAGNRNAAGDTYESYVTSVERKRIHVYGNFAAKK